MPDRILIAYATKSGSTAEIAEFIGKAFRRAGEEVDVKPLHEIASLEGYRAVLLGSPLYSGKLLKEVHKFRRKNREALSRMTRGFFVVCLAMARPSPKNVDKVITQTKGFVEVFQPVDVGLFAGKLDYDDVGFLNRVLMKLMKIPSGDFRNYDFIRTWSENVLPKLLSSG